MKTSILKNMILITLTIAMAFVCISFTVLVIDTLKNMYEEELYKLTSNEIINLFKYKL